MTKKFDRLDSMSEIQRFMMKFPTNVISKEWQTTIESNPLKIPPWYHEDVSWLIHEGDCGNKHVSEYYKFFGLE